MDTASVIQIHTDGWIASATGKLKSSHPDDVIDAWKIGVLKGLKLKDQIHEKYFNEKINSALMAANRLIDVFNREIDLKCIEAFLRIYDLDKFDFLFLVDFEAYLSDRLNAAYEEALKVKRTCKKDNGLTFNFILKPKTAQTKIENVLADGYYLKYAPEPRQAQS
jgi:hypothetical protein